MKVSCQSCSAQYNLPDDKVRGRKAKVRCKKCGASIVVDGTAESSSSPPLQAFDDEDEATRIIESPLGRPSVLWTVNLSDEDQRDMTTEDVVTAWLAKEVTNDAYVWRDGMEEWLPILSAPELVHAIRGADPSFRSEPPAAAAGQAAAAERRPPPAASSGVDLSPPAPKAAERPRTEVKAAAAPVAAKPLAAASPAKPKPQPTSPLAASPATSGGGTFGAGTAGASAAAKRPMVTAGLFGQIPEKGKPTTGKQAARTAASGGDMFGGSTRAPSQHPPKPAENSVMFSLDALKAAAAVDNSASQQDVRVSEDLLVMGGPTGYDLNPAPLIQIDMPPPAPVLTAAAPVSLAGAASAQAAQKSGSFSTILMVAAGLVIVAGAFFGVRSLTAGKSSTPADSTPVTAGAERKAAEVPAEPGVAAADKPADSPAAGEAPSATDAVKPGAAEAPAGQAAVTPKPPVVGGPSPGPRKEPTGPAKPPPPKAPVEAAAGKAGFNVSAAKDALGAAASQAKLCKSGDGPTGSGKVQVTFAPSGRVTNANVSGPPFAGTSVGGCVARAFRSARVPAFDGAPQTVSKGFAIN